MSDIMTVIGEQTVVQGNLQGDEDLTVFGKVEGGVNLTKTLILESSGIVVADIEVRDAIISGVVVGNITASNSVQITEEGRMVGDIVAPRVIIVDGASFKGAVDMGNLEAPPAERPALARRPAAAAPAPRASVPARRPTAPRGGAAEPAPSAEKSAPQKPKAPAKPASKDASKSKRSSKGSSKTKSKAKSETSSKSKTKKKSKRKPPKPPKMPAGKRKVKRR